MNCLHESLATRQQAIIGQKAAAATTFDSFRRVHCRKGELKESIETCSNYSTNKRRYTDYLDAAATICNNGQTHHLHGELVEAMKCYEEFLMIAKNSFGYNHRNVAAILKCMAEIYINWRDYDRATLLYEEAVSVGKATLGPNHEPFHQSHANFFEEIASTLNQLGDLFHKNGDLERALSTYMKELEVEREVFDQLHPNIAETLSNIANIYMSRQAYQAALCYYNEALIIQRHVFGNSHSKIASTLSFIGTIHFRTQSYVEALSVYQEVLMIVRDIHGEDHVEVALTLNSIGLTFSKLNFRRHAIEYFEKSLQVRRAKLGHFHQSLAVTLFNMGSISMELGEDDDAVTYYHEALDVERHNVQKGNTSSKSRIAILQHVAVIHEQRGEIGEAIKHLSEKLEVMTNSNNQHDTSAIAKTLSNIGSLYLQTGQTADMVAIMSNALRYLRSAGRNELDLDLSGFDLYGISKCHPECAAMA